MKIPKYIFIHHTGISYLTNPDQWKATERVHKSKGWGTGGYNYEINADGDKHQFRGDGTYTAAQWQKRMNDGRAISIALDGNFNIEAPTDEQMATLRRLIVEKMGQYGILAKNIKGHRKIASTFCPGTNIPKKIEKWLFPEPKGINQVAIKLYKDEDGPDIYLVGKDNKYHHIENAETFTYIFGGFKGIIWEEGPRPLPDKIGKPITNG